MASEPNAQFRIKRKPVSSPPPYQDYQEENRRPPLPPTVSSNTIPDVSGSSPGAATGIPAAQKSQAPAKAAIHKAYSETRYFLGGLITHPAESNRHFTMLRHSHGVVFYRGSTTTVAISIFSDTPLPPDRTLWLQSRGFSGKTGMKAKAFLRLYHDWLNVTPTMAVTADQVNPVDERAWQRDIHKFYKHATGRVRDSHHLRETAIVRVPVEAGDGYFCVVLCRGEKEKTLCTSPVFRLLSISTDPSSIRGASLSTLPLELGAMVMGMYAQATARGVMGPVVSKVQDTIPYQPSRITQKAAKTAFEVSGAGDRIAGSFCSDMGGPYTGHEDSLAIERGPVEPYPMVFKAQGEVPEGVSIVDETPRFSLKKVPDWVRERFDGYYFGWAMYEQMEEKKTTTGAWQPAILIVERFDPTGAARVDISQAMKRVCLLRLLDEVELPRRAKVEVRVMGFLRPPPPALVGDQKQETLEKNAEAAMIADACDASFAQNVLDHPAWAPDVPSADELQRADPGMMERTRAGLSTAATSGRKFAEQVPLHWIGVRSPMAEARDKRVTVNGFYIMR